MTDLFGNLSPFMQLTWTKERAAMAKTLAVAAAPICIQVRSEAISMGLILDADENYPWLNVQLTDTAHRADFLASLARRAALRLSGCGYIIIEDSLNHYHSHCAFCLIRIGTYEGHVLCCETCAVKYDEDASQMFFWLFAICEIAQRDRALRDALSGVKDILLALVSPQTTP